MFQWAWLSKEQDFVEELGSDDYASYEAQDDAANGGARNRADAGQVQYCSELRKTGGDIWTMQGESKQRPVPASVPGSNYTTQLAAGAIPDPFYGENNEKVQWVAEKAWQFERSFQVPDELYEMQHVDPVCHGLDTLATIELNGRGIDSSNNMFRTWTFDIKPHLRKGTNHLQIRFDPLTAYVQKQRAAYQQKYGIDLPNERSWVRKAPYMWGWDWCRPILTEGIWKKLEVLGYDVHISDLGVFQNHQADGSVQLEMHAELAGRTSGVHLEAQITLAGEMVATAKGAADQGESILHTTIPKPQLWWHRNAKLSLVRHSSMKHPR